MIFAEKKFKKKIDKAIICCYQGKSSLKKIHLNVALPVRVKSLLISFT